MTFSTSTDLPYVDIPAGGVFGPSFLAAGPTSGAPATLTFAGTGVDFASFLWGSPDTYNVLTVTSGGANRPGGDSVRPATGSNRCRAAPPGWQGEDQGASELSFKNVRLVVSPT